MTSEAPADLSQPLLPIAGTSASSSLSEAHSVVAAGDVAVVAPEPLLPRQTSDSNAFSQARQTSQLEGHRRLGGEVAAGNAW